MRSRKAVGLIEDGLVEGGNDAIVCDEQLEDAEEIYFLELRQTQVGVLFVEIETLQASPSCDFLPDRLDALVEELLHLRPVGLGFGGNQARRRLVRDGGSSGGECCLCFSLVCLAEHLGTQHENIFNFRLESLNVSLVCIH